MPTCQLQWVSEESGWQKTPDANEAVCVAVFTSVGPSHYKKSKFFCCAEHQKQLRKLTGKPVDKFVNDFGGEFFTFWRENSL